MQFIAPYSFKTSSSELIIITVKSSTGLLVEVGKLQIRIVQCSFLAVLQHSVRPTVYIIYENFVTSETEGLHDGL
jgi:hypothetical protein